MDSIPPEGSVRVIWREGTWRCELRTVLGYPVLRLYDGDVIELEHKITAGTISETAEVMRQAVLRYASEGTDGAVPDLRRKARRAATMMCPHCRSLRAFLWGSRPGKDWYFCPDCSRRWDLPAPS
jgi:hypothetical protein